MVYLQNSDSEPEPKPGDNFNISKEGKGSIFYFAEIKEKDDPEKLDKPDEPKPSEEVLFPSLLPQTNFRAEVVSPDKVYGDDQYVIFTKKGDNYVAITSGANCSSPLSLDKAAAAGVRLTSPDQNVLWTVNNNRDKVAEGGYYKYIRSCASNKYLAAKDGLLDENIKDDFYLADKDGSSALLATDDGCYVTLQGDKYSVTSDKASAARFYFAKLLQKEQQSSGGKTVIPEGTLLRLVDWNSIVDGKTYAIISATEFNKLHYALSGNGRLARYGADNLTNYNLCPNENVNGVYGNAPCESSVGDIFYTNGQDILWTASVSNNQKAVFKNNSTGLYLSLSKDKAAAQTPSISADSAEISIEPVDGQAYAYLGNGRGKYLGIWQYIAASVSESAPERCAYYLAEVLDENDKKNLPATELNQDLDKDTVSFGGLYSIYQGSQHLLNDGTGVENFILMDDGKGNFKPNNSAYGADNENNYYVTYCADYDANMPVFTEPGKYKAVSLDEYDGFKAEQKSALQAIISNSYPYVTEEAFLSNLKNAGFEVSANCGTDEIMAGIQAAIYSVTNPREDGEWGYESSDGWAHNSYEVNKPKSYVSDPAKAESDVNTVRDYLLSLNSTAMTAAEGSEGTEEPTPEEPTPECFAITTEKDGETWAISSSDGYNYELVPYNSEDITQLWYADDKGFIRWYPSTFDKKGYISNYFLQVNFDLYRKKFKDDSEYQYTFSHCLELAGSYMVKADDYDGTRYDSYMSNHCYGNLPLIVEKTSDGKSYLKLYDPDKKLTSENLEYIKKHFSKEGLNYPEFEIADDSAGYYLTISDIHAASKDGIRQFNKIDITPVIPEAIVYDLEELEWEFEYNDDGTAYGVTLNGKLNHPIRKVYDRVRVNLYCNDILLGNLEFEEDQQTFTVSSEKVIPDSEEAHFWIRIDEKCLDVTIFEPTEGTGWQLQIAGVFTNAIKEIHEETTSIPVEKIWGDDKDHSGDTVELVLLKDGKETKYTTKVDAKTNWKGSFKHVPLKRWTYGLYGWSDDDPPQFEIPILTHEYTMKEVNVKSGYTPVYDFGGPQKLEDEKKGLSAGTPHYVQMVLRNEDKDDLAFDLAESGGYGVYVPGKPSQQFALNGDGTLLGKIEENDGTAIYNKIYLEPDNNEPGKYNAYMEYHGMRQYMPAEMPDYSNPNFSEEEAFSKANAAVIELVEVTKDDATGTTTETVLKKMPEDAFKTVKAALEIYENGAGTNIVFDSENGSSVYVPGSDSQKYEISCYEDQFIILPNPDRIHEVFTLEPCEEDGKYIMSFTDWKGNTTYVCLNEDGMATVTLNKEEAALFGLKDAVYVNRSERFTVTNTPKPEDVVVPTPSTTSVTVKKTWKLDDGGKAADSVKVALLKNGTEEKTVTLSEENNWTYTWTGLAIGNTWTVKELDVPEGFDSTVQQSGTSFIITNDDKPDDPTKPDDPNKPDDPEKPDKPTKPEKPDKPTKPGKPTNPNKPSKPNQSMVPDDALIPGGSGGSGSASGSGSPKTGDSANAVPWLVVMGLSAGGLTALLLSKRRKTEKNEN